jgi:hypothetical protein
MKSLIKILSVLTFFILSLNFVRAQTYPVLANVYIIPPYGSYLSDYYTSSREKLVVTLLNRDQQEPVLEAYLRMTVTSSTGLRIQNRPEINYPSITLDAGVPVRLSQEDLTPYFLPQNIIQQGYLNQGKLPNGMIEFTFQAIEKYTGKILSAPATGRIWLTTQKPPLLVFPNNHENVAFREPLNLKFQWQPQHNNISQVEYEFELREIPENGAAPQSAFLYSPIIHQERFFYTNFIYSAIHPMLDAGKTYGWRVRAIAKDGVDELNLFENNGYSEIFFFKSGSGCEPPVVTANVHDYQLDLTWQALDGASEYEVQFCNKYEGTGEWRKYITTNTHYTFYSLQLSSTYMYRVGTKCNNGSFVYGNVFEFKMPDVDSARLENCGMIPDIDLSNREPLQELNVGDVFMASDYPVTVTKVTDGSNGVFSGEGWLPVKWIFNSKFKVEFKNILINTDKIVIEGDVNFKYDPNWSQVADLDGSDGNSGNDGSGGIKSDITVDFVIPPNPEFEYNDSTGVLVIYDLSGTPHNIELPKNSEGKVVFPVTIKDANGNVYEVNEETYIDEDGNEQKKVVITEVEEGDKNINYDANIESDESDYYTYFIVKKINEAITDTEAENIIKETLVENYYLYDDVANLDEGKYVIIPVRKKIRYIYRNCATQQSGIDTITKNMNEFIPYLTTDCNTYTLIEKWSENPYNKYTIEKTVNNVTDKSENINYLIVDLIEGEYNFKANRYAESGKWFCDDIKPDTILKIIPGIIGKLKINVKKIDSDAVWFDYVNELAYNGAFGFDAYNDNILSAFKAKYTDKIEIQKTDGSKIDYRVPSVSNWAGESTTVKAVIKQNTSGSDLSYTFESSNGLTIESMQCNGNFYTNGKFEEQNGNYELIITLSTNQNKSAKYSLSVKDRDGKLVGKLNYYSKVKPKDKDISYKYIV